MQKKTAFSKKQHFAFPSQSLKQSVHSFLALNRELVLKVLFSLLYVVYTELDVKWKKSSLWQRAMKFFFLILHLDHRRLFTTEQHTGTKLTTAYKMQVYSHKSSKCLNKYIKSPKRHPAPILHTDQGADIKTCRCLESDTELYALKYFHWTRNVLD